jgi:hypothetical protein
LRGSIPGDRFRDGRPTPDFSPKGAKGAKELFAFLGAKR